MTLATDIKAAIDSSGIDWSSVENLPSLFKSLGKVSFAGAREIQNDYVRKRIAGEVPDCIFLCEHPPTLSLGKRVDVSQMGINLDSWREAGAEVVRSDRGGLVTYHGPGQLIIYPVISLKDTNLGVKTFVSAVFGSIKGALESYGVKAICKVEPAGVWLNQGQKIAACGLRVERGVSNHGFSVNIRTNLSPYRHFDPCGQKAETTSLEQVVSIRTCSDKSFVEKLCSILCKDLSISL
jgi:lipoate-protein ligase B